MEGKRSLVDGSCKECKEWKEHYYWNHLEEKGKYFSKIMAGDFSQRMNVPNNFFKNFKGQISEIVTLKGPCGNTWKVRSTKSETCLSFQNGWNDFVKAHHIQECDILIFRYDGDSCFDVLIFDEDGCEKTSSVVLRSINLHMQEKTDNSSKEAEHSSSTTLYINLSESQGERVCCKSPKTCERHHVKEEPGEMDEISTSEFISCRRLSGADGNKASKLAQDIPKENPIFVAVMQRSNVSGNACTLCIPARFRTEYLPSKITRIILRTRTSRRQWFVRLSGERRALTGATWKKFVAQHNLKKGDMCVFELTAKGETPRMKVHIA